MTEITLDLTVAAPCYNEAESLRELHRRVREACESMGLRWELVLVNDGSTDETWQTMLALAAEDAHVVAVDLSRNHGQQLAMTAALSLSRGERLLMIDADLQDPPELLPKMWARMDDGVDVVYGQRIERKGESGFKLGTAAAFYWLIGKLADTHIPRNTGDFRLISRRVVEALLAMPERHRFMRGMVSWVGYRQEAMQFERDARYAGKTAYSFKHMWRLAVDAVTGFSIRPLQMASLLGFVCAAGSAFVLLYALSSWLFFDTERGWTSLIAVVAFFGGVQLMVLGVMGEYLGRMFEQVRGRPLFMIDKVVRGGGQPGETETDRTA